MVGLDNLLAVCYDTRDTPEKEAQMFQRKTLNRMSPKTRKLAQQANEAEKLWRNLKRQVEVMRELEFDSLAFNNEQRFKARHEVKATEHPDRETAIDESALGKATSKLW